MRQAVSALFAALAMSGGALAQTSTAPNPPAASPATAVKPPAPAPKNASTAAKPALPALSESKFLAELYTEIARHTPEKSPAGDGEVSASFHVNAQGKVDKVVIDKTTSPGLAEEVKKILAQVQAPPPPGGGEDVGQTFKFHAE
ncbi:MAG TPA: TonB C-terminal domain-containing protein [Methylocystis sp.]|nr:TonB C-terminal domain-containing protein [Methylocystis sp.]